MRVGGLRVGSDRIVRLRQTFRAGARCHGNDVCGCRGGGCGVEGVTGVPRGCGGGENGNRKLVFVKMRGEGGRRA